MKALKYYLILFSNLLFGTMCFGSNPCLVGDPSTYITINAPMGSTTATLSDFISPNGPLPAGGAT